MAVLQHGMAAAAADTSDPVTNSLRFDSASSSVLTRTPSSNGDRQKYTIALWFKIGSKNSYDVLFAAKSSSSSDQDAIYFNNSDSKLIVQFDGIGICLKTTQEFRDPSAWYHLTLTVDTTQSGAGNRARLYINGVEVSAFDTNNRSSITQNSNSAGFNNTQLHVIGNAAHGGYDYYDGYIADVYFVDGSAVAPVNNFIQDNGYNGYKPKAYDMSSHGGNSFHLKFDDSSSIGEDSANSNDFTTSNLGSHDVVLDTPTNNYAVMSPIDVVSYQLKEGNLRATGNNSAGRVRSTMGFSSGKWYWEFYLKAYSNGGGYGIAKIDSELSGSTGDLGHDSNSWGVLTNNGNTKHNNSTGSSSGSATSNDILMCALDMDNGKVFFGKNGNWLDSGNPSTGANPFWSSLSGTIGAALGMGSNSSQDWVFNFGQDPTFASNKTSGQDTSQDEFYYAPPSGFKALSTGNMTNPPVKAHQNFNTTLHTGYVSSVTGVGFQPDLTWIKQRSGPNRRHHLQDSVRGAGNVLFPNDSTSETNSSSYQTSFDPDGFSMGSSSEVNGSGKTYVAWHWKENASAGFDIATWTGSSINSGDYATVSHSLGVVPELVIVKNRTGYASPYGSNTDWIVYHKDLGTGSYGYKKFLRLNENATSEEGGYQGYAGLIDNLTTTSFRAYNEAGQTTYNNHLLNFGYSGTNDTYVAYLFASVDGMVKVGSYVGNGSSDGAFVYTGHRPRFLLIKRYDGVSRWRLVDTVRDPYNVSDTQVFAEDNIPENSGGGHHLDILSNGFKWRTSDGDQNGQYSKYLYVSMAESPFKHANAR